MSEAYTALPRSFEGLLKACVSFHEKTKDKAIEEHAKDRRADLASFAKVFHSECGTLTPEVQESIERLESGNCVVLMTAHQPNFFAYSGVLRKATLNFCLAKRLETVLRIPVVSFFGIADQDFTDDRWVRSCELPSALRSGGVLSIEAKLPEKLMLNRVAKPSRDLLNSWKFEVEKWLYEGVRSVARLCRVVGLNDATTVSTVSELKRNLDSFWRIAEKCWERSKTYSDLNGFLMSEIVNNAWTYNTVFVRFSECQQAFAEDFAFLLSHFDDYSRLMKETIRTDGLESLRQGVSDQEPFLVPFWYHCHCGGKAKLFLNRMDGHIFGDGNCVQCNEPYHLDLGRDESPSIIGLASQISARAIPMALVFFNGIVPSCYVGGAGGVGYLVETEHIAKGLGIVFPPVAIWRPKDKYSGVGQTEAILEVRRICRYLGTEVPPVARDLLLARICDARGRIEKLEQLKNDIIEKLRTNPGDHQLKEQMKEILAEKAKVLRSSNFSVLCHELKILEDALKALELVPSIIDYAINFGLKEISPFWVRHLRECGDLFSDVKMESAPYSAINFESIV